MLILDFYVDEPSCLGVPPYVSPYVRYIAGALVDGGIPAEKISYLTVDSWRDQGMALNEDHDIVFIVAGSTVPGKYLGGRIGTVKEIFTFLEYQKKYNRGSETIIGGPVRHASIEILRQIQEMGGTPITGDIEHYAYSIASAPSPVQKARDLKNEDAFLSDKKIYSRTDVWAQKGAFLTTLHPGFPYLMMELETYRGCTRSPHCSFCTESLYGTVEFRPLDGIHEEAAELYRMGNRYFRLGRQADILTYGHEKSGIIRGFPRPNPVTIESLYSGIRRAAPELKVLHLDNVNPGGIAAHPAASREALRIIASLNTPGDTAAMGMESADSEVIKLNHLKANADQVYEAVRIVNEEGGIRKDGIPAILPGLNLVQGLPGETEETFKINYEFLRRIFDNGLLLRRTNIRRVVPYRGTLLDPASNDDEHDNVRNKKQKSRSQKKLEERFIYYREKIREDIDRPMLGRIFPAGTVIHEVLPEQENTGNILGRPFGSYPVTIKVPSSDKRALYALHNRRTVSVIITGSEERSLTAMSIPITINTLSEPAIRTLPGVGKKRASRIIIERPIRNADHLRSILEEKLFCDDHYFDFES